VLLLEITSRAEGSPTPEPPSGIVVPGATFLGSASFVAGSATGGGIVTSGLVMHLDAGDAASYPGSGTAWTDLSGNGNTLTAINSPTWDSGGWFATGAAGYFERASGTNIPQGNDPYTLQVWIRLPFWAPLQFNGIMQIGTAGVTNRSNGIRTFNQTVGHFNHFWWANDIIVSNNNASLSTNVWFMLTVSFDLTTRKIKGVLVS
jgi:hypothetical protein